MLDYIPNDGYTEEAYIEAAPGHHGEFRFTYRPFLVEERARLIAANNTVKPEEYERLCASEVAKKLTAWSLTDKGGRPVPITAGNVLRLKPRLNARLFGIVVGLEATDVDPRWGDAAKADAIETKLESALTATVPGDVREEADEKN